MKVIQPHKDGRGFSVIGEYTGSTYGWPDRDGPWSIVLRKPVSLLSPVGSRSVPHSMPAAPYVRVEITTLFWEWGRREERALKLDSSAPDDIWTYADWHAGAG